MGLISFIAEAGMKVFGPDNSDLEAPTKSIRQHLADNQIDTQHIKTQFKNGQVVLQGWAASSEQREKAVLVAGNIKGVSEVDDQLRVGTPDAVEEGSAASASAPPTASAPGPLGVAVSSIESGALGAVDGWSSATYTVKKGDTLSAIAKAAYGKASRYPLIFEANRPMLSDPDKIYPGQVLRIPPIED